MKQMPWYNLISHDAAGTETDIHHYAAGMQKKDPTSIVALNVLNA